MGTLFLLLACSAGYLVAYHTYGKFLARRIFRISDANVAPSERFNDGTDYVPTRKSIIFGHHYTSIAGTGPIVGPAIGIIWGWLPAILWIVFGSIFMGAVHDFGTLVVSMRNEGKSISDVASKYINFRVRFIFFCVVFLTLLIVIAVFGVVIASVFSIFPSSVLAVWLQIPIAIILGRAIYRYNLNVTFATLLAVAAMYATIYLGSLWPITMPSMFGIPDTGVWVIILLIYAWVASTLPVTMLLQPRDYINAWQLFVAMGLLMISVITATFTGGLEIAAPAINHNIPAGTPAMFPFMFVLIACGAISGFHALVASGTSPKQVARESDSLFIGYGSMLLEGLLAVLVIICVASGLGMALKIDANTTLTGSAAWQHQYAVYLDAKGLGDKLAPVVIGAANMMKTAGVPENLGIALMGVFIASFAGTTLDTSARLQRYVISELAAEIKLPLLANRWVATTAAVVTAAVLAFATGAGGKGALKIWPLFGSANQLLAALALLVVTIYLKRKGGLKYLFTLLPCIFMLIITGWAIIINEIEYSRAHNYLLVVIGGINMLLAIWMTIEAAVVLCRPQTKTENITLSKDV